MDGFGRSSSPAGRLDRSNLGEPCDCEVVLAGRIPADGGCPRGGRLRGGVERRGVEAASQLEQPPGRITAEVGDARDLPVADHAFDAALLFGPLYHLTDRDDRLRAWAETTRVVRPGGLIFVAAISRFASLFDGLAEGYLFDPAFRQIVERDLAEGQHRNPTGAPDWFTTAYFHHPDELRTEARASGVEVLELVGVEGLAAWLPQLSERWSTPEGREAILFAARCIESDPSLLGLSAHLIAVTRVID